MFSYDKLNRFPLAHFTRFIFFCIYVQQFELFGSASSIGHGIESRRRCATVAVVPKFIVTRRNGSSTSRSIETCIHPQT